ncbi:MAG: hypothetical protein HUU43_12900 [Ignavibacteriaceae bacterium]|nr:hypothetical protein [Ignavibacteriaceae bacterium]NUM71741.1 hypothetical protein [Ignavibacteriaceae bacterium]
MSKIFFTVPILFAVIMLSGCDNNIIIDPPNVQKFSAEYRFYNLTVNGREVFPVYRVDVGGVLKDTQSFYMKGINGKYDWEGSEIVNSVPFRIVYSGSGLTADITRSLFLSGGEKYIIATLGTPGAIGDQSWNFESFIMDTTVRSDQVKARVLNNAFTLKNVSVFINDTVSARSSGLVPYSISGYFYFPKQPVYDLMIVKDSVSGNVYPEEKLRIIFEGSDSLNTGSSYLLVVTNKTSSPESGYTVLVIKEK